VIVCERGHPQSWIDTRFGCADCGRRRAPHPKIRHGIRGDCRDYREDLARFPGDPEAYVDGPRSLQKLIDKRKRQGWVDTGLRPDDLERMVSPRDVPDLGIDSDKLLRECLAEAHHEVSRGEDKDQTLSDQEIGSVVKRKNLGDGD